MKASGETVAEVARDLSINDTTLGNWVKADRAERGVPDETGLLSLTAAERVELTGLRRENAQLKTEREIPKGAARGATESGEAPVMSHVRGEGQVMPGELRPGDPPDPRRLGRDAAPLDASSVWTAAPGVPARPGQA